MTAYRDFHRLTNTIWPTAIDAPVTGLKDEAKGLMETVTQGWGVGRIALASVVAIAVIANALWFTVWYRRSHEPGVTLRREFTLGVISTVDGRQGLGDAQAPIKILRVRLRRIRVPGGMRVGTGGYSFVAPTGARRISVTVAPKGRPPLTVAATYAMPSGKRHRARVVVYTQKYYAVPNGMATIVVAVCAEGRHRTFRFLVPMAAASVQISVRGGGTVVSTQVGTPAVRMVLMRPGILPRTMLRWLLEGPGVYRGFSMRAWRHAMAACGVKPKVAFGTMRRIIGHHLALDTDLRIERSVLRATWGRLEGQTRLGAAVWAALCLQMLGVEREGTAVWVHMPDGRRMVLFSGVAIVFNHRGRAILDGLVHWRQLPSLALAEQMVVPFFAQPGPPGFWRHWPR